MTSASQILHFECLTSPHALSHLRDVWSDMRVEHPFLDWGWLSSWWNAFGESHSLYLVVGYQESAVRVIAPWYVHNSFMRGKEIRFIGSGRACGDFMSLIQHPMNDIDLTQMAIEGIAELITRDPRWDTINFDGVSKNDDAMHSLDASLQRRGVETRFEPGLSTWRLELPSSWDEYLAGCRKKTRQKLRRVLRDAEQQARFHLCEDPQLMDRYYEKFVDLHILRRNELNDDDGCFDTVGFREFLHSASKQFQSADRLWLGQLDFDGEAAACGMAFEYDDTLHFYQSGSNPKFNSIQPGWLLNAKLIQTAIERKLKAIDYLRGDEPYKARLSATPTSQRRLLAVANHVTSKTRDRLWQTARTIKHKLDDYA